MTNHRDDWGQYIDAAVFATNTSIQGSSKVTPFRMMFGREPRFPLEVEKKGLDDDDIDEAIDSISRGDQESYLDSLVSKQQQLFDVAHKNIQAAQERQITQYRKRKGIVNYSFTKGDHVLRRNMKQKTRKGSKSEDRWLGPYTISELSATSCVLMNVGGKRLKTRINLNQLKPYLGVDDQHCKFMCALCRPASKVSLLNP
jgi:hypothetical protein